MDETILNGVKTYYSDKIARHGNSFLGVDWNSKESQYLRFKQLCSIIEPEQPFSLLDYGCGYGELVNYLQTSDNPKSYSYYGYDISDKMIEAASAIYKNVQDTCFSDQVPEKKFDYLIASGIFNVKLDLASDAVWQDYIVSTLQRFSEATDKAFAFNALTMYSDKDHIKQYLYYADPLFLFDYCKKKFSKKVSLIHDYELYEFTLIVKK